MAIAADTPARLQIYLLGTFEVSLDGVPLSGFRSDKVRALLAFLAVESGRTHRRSSLASLLWGEYPEPSARQSLSQALTNLRQLLSPLEAARGSPPVLESSREEIRWDPAEEMVWVDVQTFDALLEDSGPTSDPTERSAAAVALYHGPFLAGLSLPDSQSFEEWRLIQQERRHEAALLALERLATHHLAAGSYAQAQAFARRQIAMESWREKAHRQLMLALALDGQRGMALQQYEICRQYLLEELGVGPDRETVALYEQIWQGELGPRETPRPPTATAEALLPANPYRGLFPFLEEDATCFFGRESFIQRLQQAVHRQPAIALLGRSGSGKSSLIFAGLLPRLRDATGQEATGWQIAALRPGSRPFQALARALLPLLEADLPPSSQAAWVKDLAEAMRRRDMTLCAAIEQILTGGPRGESDRRKGLEAAGHPSPESLLIVIDQFEELFTACPDAATRQAFLDHLLDHLSHPPRLPCTLLLSLRADFLGPVLAHRPLADVLQDASLILSPMTRDELAEAVERPALAQGVLFEPGLVERILDDVGQEPGHLALLQFALTSLWERQVRGDLLTHAAYDAIGGVPGALANYAEEVYLGFDPLERETARRTFVQLVRPGQQTQDTRRTATRPEMGREEWAMVQKLTAARLVVTGGGSDGEETAELVHETLIDGWARMGVWLNEDRAFRLWQERLRTWLRPWIASERDVSALLRGNLLAEAEEWYTARGDELTDASREYIEASLAHRQRQQQAATAQQQRELAQAQALAEAEQRRANVEARAGRRLRWLLAGLSIVFLLALLAVGQAIVQRQETTRQASAAVAAQGTAEAEWGRAEAAQAMAEEQARVAKTERLRAEEQARVAEAAQAMAQEQARVAEAERARAKEQAGLALARQLAAQSVTLLDKQPDLALLLSLEAYMRAEPGEERGAYLTSLAFDPLLTQFLHGHEQAIYYLACHPDGGPLTSMDASGTVLVWDLETGQPVEYLPWEESDIDTGGSLSRDGRTVARRHGASIHLADAFTGQDTGPAVTDHAADITNLSLDPDGSVLVSGDAEGTIRVWKVTAAGLQERPLTRPLSYDGGGCWGVSTGGQLLAMTAPGHSVVIHDLETGELRTQIPDAHPGFNLHSMLFSPDGGTLATNSFDQTVGLWDATSGQSIGSLRGHEGRVLASAFDEGGRRMASGGTDNLVRLWDITVLGSGGGAQQVGPALGGHSNWVRVLAFCSGTRLLASGDSEGKILLWDLGRRQQLRGHDGQVRGVSFSPDGTTLASGGFDFGVVLWDLTASPPTAHELSGHSNVVLNVLFGPDGQRLASAGSQETFLWDLSAGIEVGSGEGQPARRTLVGHEGPVVGLAFSPDGRTLATGSFDQTIRLWNAADGQSQGPGLSGHEGWVLDLAYSPDGSILASASSDGTLRLWDAATGEPLGSPLTGHRNWVTSVAFSPDGQILASGSSDNTIRLWDVAKREALGSPLAGHAAQVWSVAFRDSQHLVSGAADGTVLVWDLWMREPLGPPLMSGVEMETMALSPDGTTVAIGSFDDSGTVTLWQVPAESWPVRACTLANRNLTEEEWGQYLGDQPYERTCTDLRGGH
jgi:WD40 repeat protein/DNA-binding SARP family transcriptional activator